MNEKILKILSWLFIITIVFGNYRLIFAYDCKGECERGFYQQYGRNPNYNNPSDAEEMNNCITECEKYKSDLGLEDQEEGGEGGGLIIKNPLSPVSDIWQLIMRLILIAQNIGVFVCILLIVWAGYLYVTSAGNEEKIKQAQKTLIWALVGFGIIIIAGAVPRLIYEFITGKSWENLYNESSSEGDGGNIHYTQEINYPSSQPSGGMIYNSSTGECEWSETANGDDISCIDDLLP